MLTFPFFWNVFLTGWAMCTLIERSHAIHIIHNIVHIVIQITFPCFSKSHSDRHLYRDQWRADLYRAMNIKGWTWVSDSYCENKPWGKSRCVTSNNMFHVNNVSKRDWLLSLWELVYHLLYLANGLVGMHARNAQKHMRRAQCPIPTGHQDCFFPSAQTKACDMFIKQQGSHYRTQQPPCHNAHT